MLTKLLPRGVSTPIQSIDWPALGGMGFGTSEPEAQEPEQGDDREIFRLRDEVAALRSQLQALHQQAERQVGEAHTAGREAGAQAVRESFEQQLMAESTRLNQMMADLLAAGPRIRHHAEEDLVKLAVAIARRILHREITVDADTMLGLIKAALTRIDQREIHLVRTDPESLAVVNKVLREIGAERAVKVVPDPALKRGSLLIETSRGHLDASIETQLQEIQRGFADMVRQS